jgi:superfamily II DNA helicase RecQ
LHSLGFKATYYHGGLTSREKIKTCSFGWTIKPNIVATNAFGMGIDKAETVIHIQLQKISKIIIKKQVDLAEMEKKHLRYF